MNQQSNFTQNFSQNIVEQQILGRALVKMEIRIQSIELKLGSLTKVVRLLQQYSEKKDMQYQKETHNMQIVDSKLTKIDNLQQQLTMNISRNQQLNKHIHSLTLKIDQINKNNLQKQKQIQGRQDKINFDMEQINRKLNSLQSTILRQGRENHKNQQESNNLPSNSQHYLLEELTFRIAQLQSKVGNQNQLLQPLLQRPTKSRKQLIKVDSNYGLNTDRSRKSKQKKFSKQAEPLLLRRLKSK